MRPRQAEPLPVRLTRQRIYILPTASGLFVACVLGTMMLGDERRALTVQFLFELRALLFEVGEGSLFGRDRIIGVAHRIGGLIELGGLFGQLGIDGVALCGGRTLGLADFGDLSAHRRESGLGCGCA